MTKQINVEKNGVGIRLEYIRKQFQKRILNCQVGGEIGVGIPLEKYQWMKLKHATG